MGNARWSKEEANHRYARLKTRLRYVIATVLFIVGIASLAGFFDDPLSSLIHRVINKNSSEHTLLRFHILGGLFAGCALILLLWDRFIRRRAMGWIANLHKTYQKWIAWVDEWLMKNLVGEEIPPAIKGGISKWDALILLVFLLFSGLLTLGKLEGYYPNIHLTGDAANIASYAAARYQPELFKGDALLDNLENIRVYSSILIFILPWLYKVVGNYGLAMGVMLGPHIFIFLVGWYLLGRVILKDRFWAFLFAVVNAMPKYINLGESWGIIGDPLPRFTLQAILPYLLALVWICRKQPRRWPWLMVLVGGLAFIHPVSTPIWIAAIWIGFGWLLPRGWSKKKRVGVMIGLGLLAILAAMPYIITYLGHHVQGKSPGYDLVYYIIQNEFPVGLINAPYALAHFVKNVGMLIPFSLLGLFFLWRAKSASRTELLLPIGWISGIFTIAGLFPWVEHSVERALRMVPLETELLRGIRYFIPFMFLFILWPLKELHYRLKKPSLRKWTAGAGLLFVGTWAMLYPPFPELIGKAVNCLGHGKLICASRTDLDKSMDAIRTLLPEGAPVFFSGAMNSSEGYGLAIRYQALHPLVFSYKDRGQLVYSNEAALQEWHDAYLRLEPISYTKAMKKKLAIVLNLASDLNAQYILLDFYVKPVILVEKNLTSIYANNTYNLVDIRGFSSK